MDANGWMPLDTAPSDKSVLLAYKYGLGVALGHKTEHGEWISPEGTSWGNGTSRFTHWMPEPAPPETADGR